VDGHLNVAESQQIVILRCVMTITDNVLRHILQVFSCHMFPISGLITQLHRGCVPMIGVLPIVPIVPTEVRRARIFSSGDFQIPDKSSKLRTAIYAK